MPKLLLDSDDEDGPSSKTNQFTINESYATAYERWRRKEEYQKLKDKYGEDILSEDSVASADDDDEDDSDDESGSSDFDESIFDQKFLKVYGALKSRDPNIYNEKVRFFDDDDGDGHVVATDGGNDTGDVGDDDDDSPKMKKKKKKDKGMNLLEYHVNLVKKEKGMTEEDRLMETGEQPINPKHGPDKASYVQEMETIKKEFKNILAEDDDDGGELIKGVKKIPVPERKPDPSDILRDASKSDKRIGFLANYWDKKNLDDREKFLKEYILGKKYLDPSDTEGGMSITSRLSSKSKPSTDSEFASSSSSKFAESDRNANKDENANESGDSESDSNDQEGMQVAAKLSKINEEATAYHYQESNAQVIKRYPREVESVRNLHGSTVRNVKRSEIKERKAKEKAEGLQRFRELCRAEVKSKLAKLKEISGNDRLLLEDKQIDIDAIVDDITNFDPEKYDECMSKLFDEQFYDVSSTNPHQQRNLGKPKFDFIPGIDDVDDNLNPISQGEGSSPEAAEEEDIDGDVYDDYDEDDDGPSTSKGKKKNKRENKKKTEKEPAEKKNIGIYEDLIAGEVPTRFRYRQVPPNDFGLSPEELLLADDKELNRWVSLKKTSQHRTIEEEKYDIKVYGRKATDYALKKKILKSVYDPEAAEKDDQQQNQSTELDTQPGPSTSANAGASSVKKSSKRRRHEGKELESINLTEERLRSYDLPFRAIKKLKGRLHRKRNQSKRK